MRINRFLICVAFMLAVTGLQAKGDFVQIDGKNLVKPNGERLYIQGTNLGNWLNPEGYMFGFSRTNSAWMIDLMMKEMVGPDATASFWQSFRQNYITKKDIEFIARQGANTIRLPFNYKLFTDEYYMGETTGKDAFGLIDRVVDWCRETGLYLIFHINNILLVYFLTPTLF